MTEKEKTKVVEEVRQTFEGYHSDIRRSGLTAELKYLDSSEDFFWVPPGYAGPLSYDTVAAILKRFGPRFRSIDNSFAALQIFPLSNELATYTGRLHSVKTDTSGRTKTTSLVETGILIRRPDGWKLLGGQTSVLHE